MIAEDLISDVKNTQKISLKYQQKIYKFLEDTRNISEIFLGNQKQVYVGGYIILKKKPWFLNSNFSEMIIKSNKKIIVSWITSELDYRTPNWELEKFNFNDIENVKDFLYNLKSVMDIDLLEIKLDGIEEETSKKFKELEYENKI